MIPQIDARVAAVDRPGHGKRRGFLRFGDHPGGAIPVGFQEPAEQGLVRFIVGAADDEHVARHVQAILDFDDVDLAEALQLADKEAGVGRRRGVDLALDDRREVQEAGHLDRDVGLGQSHLMQQDLQVLASAARQAVDADGLPLKVLGLRDAAPDGGDDIEHVLGIDVVDRDQILALIQRLIQRGRVGERHLRRARQHVDDGGAAACPWHIAEVDAFGLEEALVRLGQQIGDLADRLAPACDRDLVQRLGRRRRNRQQKRRERRKSLEHHWVSPLCQPRSSQRSSTTVQ